jgi:hypothetical protein
MASEKSDVHKQEGNALSYPLHHEHELILRQRRSSLPTWCVYQLMLSVPSIDMALQSEEMQNEAIEVGELPCTRCG